MNIDCFFNQLAAPLGCHSVTDPPGYNIPGMKIYNGTKVHEAPSHWHIGNIDTPDLVRVIYLQAFQKVWIYFIFAVFPACIWLTVKRLPAHLTHKSYDSFAINLEPLLIEPFCYSLDTVKWRFKILLV